MASAIEMFEIFRIFHIFIGLVAITLAWATMHLPSAVQTSLLTHVRLMEMMASGLLGFAILKNNIIHKPEFLLIWLGTSLLFVYAVLYGIHDYMSYIEHYTYKYTPWMIVYLVGISVLMTLMMYVIYNEYVRLVEKNKLTFSQPIDTGNEPVANKC